MMLDLTRWRAGISLLLTIVVVLLINYFMVGREEVWLLVPLIITALNTRGKPFRQGALYVGTMVAAIALAGFLTLNKSMGMYVAIPITFFIVGNVAGTLTYYFLLMLIIAVIVHAPTWVLIQDRMINVGFGSLIGYLAGQIILPVNIAAQFRAGLQPMLRSLLDYLNVIASRIKHYYDPDGNMNVVTSRIELILSGGKEAYPEWVYAAGFNPALRAGFRFFLMRVERLMELLMSLNCIMDRINYHYIPEKAAHAIDQSMQKNAVLLDYVLNYIKSGKTLSVLDGDDEKDIRQLEVDVAAILPESIESLDLFQDYIEVAALVYAVRDFRKTILQVVLAIDN